MFGCAAGKHRIEPFDAKKMFEELDRKQSK